MCFFIMRLNSVKKKNLVHYQLSCSNAPIVLSTIYITNWTGPVISYFFPKKDSTNIFILLQATKFTITYLPFFGPEEHIPGRNSVDQLIEQANISSQMFSFSKVRFDLYIFSDYCSQYAENYLVQAD